MKIFLPFRSETWPTMGIKRAREIEKPYGKYKEQQAARIRELEKRSPALSAAKAKLKAVEEALGKRKREMGVEFDKLHPGRKDRALRAKRDAYVLKRTADMVRQVGAAKKAIADAADKAMAPYVPEKLWTGSFAYQMYRGYYNTNYSRYIRDHAKALIGGADMRENIGFLVQLQKVVAGDKGWSTSVDWDWRMRQEADGTIKDLPLMQKWIRRARGAVVVSEE